MGLKKYLPKFFRKEGPEPSSEGLGRMVDLCIEYLPNLRDASGMLGLELAMSRIERFSYAVSTLTDEEMHSYIKKNYNLPERETRAFVRKSKDCRKDTVRILTT